MSEQADKQVDQLQQTVAEGLVEHRLVHSTGTEALILATRLLHESAMACYQRARAALDAGQGSAVEIFVFDDPVRHPSVCELFADEPAPMTWIASETSAAPFGGILIRALHGCDVQPIRIDDQLCGCAYDDGQAQWLRLGGLTVHDSRAAEDAQTAAVFSQAEQALAHHGFTMLDVVRTWFFNRDILAWYDRFNSVRTRFFRERGVFDHLIPASTGIGAGNSSGSALSAAMLALRDRQGGQPVRALPSPLQCPALDYDSSFSRAIEITLPGHRRISVSGTASIARDGRSMHHGDIVAQVALTLDVVGNILHAHQMDWADVVFGFSYIRQAEESGLVCECLARHGLDGLPLIHSNNVVCRDDLLWELEIEALRCST